MKKDLVYALKTAAFVMSMFTLAMWGCMIFGSLFFLGGKEHYKVLPFLYSAPVYLVLIIFLEKRGYLTPRS